MSNAHATLHQWVYVIIPIGSSGYDKPLFCAFCKSCRTYFTETVPTSSIGVGRLSSSTLPKYGCEPIDEIPTIDQLG